MPNRAYFETTVIYIIADMRDIALSEINATTVIRQKERGRFLATLKARLGGTELSLDPQSWTVAETAAMIHATLQRQ